MKKLLCMAALTWAGLTAGCSSPCDTLADMCSKCSDAALKQACDQTVATYRAIPLTSNNACQAVLDAKTYDSCKSPRPAPSRRIPSRRRPVGLSAWPVAAWQWRAPAAAAPAPA